MINFDEATHTYTNHRNEVLISVSTIIHLYAQPFDPTGAILKACAERKGMSEKELQAEWDKERDDANVRGKSFHSQAEHWINSGEVADGDYKDVVEQLTKFPFKGNLISEQIVYSNKLKIAGTIDLIEDLDDDFIKLYDFKTNKALKTVGFFNRKTREYASMRHPVSHLHDCNWVHYCLQLSGYQIIQEEMGKHVVGREIIYVNPKTRRLERYKVPDLTKEFKDIVKHYSSVQL